MLFELVKNSLRAVQERFQDADHDCPPIRVVVADGVEDVTIKVHPSQISYPMNKLKVVYVLLVFF